jgi:kumamolisin
VAVAAEAFGTTYLQYQIAGFPSTVVAVTPAVPPTALAPGLAGRIDRVYGAVGLYDATTGGILGGTAPSPPKPRSTPPAGAPRPATGGPADGGTPWRTGTPTDACPDAAAIEAFGQPVGLSPTQVRTAYGIDALWAAGGPGAGARIAVASVGFHDPADLDAYRACFGLEGTPVTDHVVGTVLPGVNLETTIDLQRVVSVAPRAARIDLFVGYDADGGSYQPTRQLFEMLANPLDASLTDGEDPDVVSLSYGYCEGYLSAADPGFAPLRDITEQMLTTAAAAGVGVYVASGDYGASGCLDAFPPLEDTEPSVWWPSSAAWVTSVGGTNLTLAPDNAIVTTGGWNDVRYGEPWASACLGCAGGGGYSAATPRPWFQAGAPGAPGGATRLVPDVAAFADLYPGYLHYQGGAWSYVGGTSAAAPITAAAFALQAAIARAEGRPAVGFVNPMLYDLARAGDPAGIVRDILEGTNDAYGPGYEAGPGYDLVTGLGSPRHDRVLALLRERARVAEVRFVG